MGKPAQTTLYLVRHCEYQQADKFIPLRTPRFGLSKAGIERAHELGKFFKPKKIAAIYTSPLLRTRQTAAIIGSHIKLTPRFSNLVLEVYSPLGKIIRSDFEKMGGSIYFYPAHQRGGETIQQIFSRVHKLIVKILRKYAGKKIIVVTHGDPIMLAIYGLVDKNLSLLHKKQRPYVSKGAVIRLIFTGNFLDSCEQIFPLVV